MKKVLIVLIAAFLIVLSSCQANVSQNKNVDNSITSNNSPSVNEATQRDSIRSEHHRKVISALNKRMYDMIEAEKPLFPVCDYIGLAEFLVPDYLDELPMDPLDVRNYTYVTIPDGYSFYFGYWRESDGGTYGEGFITNSEKNDAVLNELFTKALPINPFR